MWSCPGLKGLTAIIIIISWTKETTTIIEIIYRIKGCITTIVIIYGI